MHQASLPVGRGIGRELTKAGLVNNRELNFSMRDIQANSSSATTLVAWEHSRMTLDKPFLIAAPGIGSVITAAIIGPATA